MYRECESNQYRTRTSARKQCNASGRYRRCPRAPAPGDKPNPNLRTSVEAHLQERPYNPETDKYNVPAFDQAMEILMGMTDK